jgi:hypothetical protein
MECGLTRKFPHQGPSVRSDLNVNGQEAHVIRPSRTCPSTNLLDAQLKIACVRLDRKRGASAGPLSAAARYLHGLEGSSEA